jgi:hypothetical protein
VIRACDAGGNLIGTHEHVGDFATNDASILLNFESHLCHTFASQKFLARVYKAAEHRGMKTTPKTRPGNVTSFILEGCWPLDGFDQRELRRLSKIAKRNGVGVADVIYEAVESFVAKCEAEADLEEKVIKFPTVANRS